MPKEKIWFACSACPWLTDSYPRKGRSRGNKQTFLHYSMTRQRHVDVVFFANEEKLLEQVGVESRRLDCQTWCSWVVP